MDSSHSHGHRDEVIAYLKQIGFPENWWSWGDVIESSSDYKKFAKNIHTPTH